MIELTTILKDEEKTMRQKFLIYDTITASQDDSTILACIAEAMKSFVGQPESITVKITLDILK